MKLISGRVYVRYCRAPKILLYKVGSEKGIPSAALSRTPTEYGEDSGLESNKFVFLRRSRMYLC
ncbi:hypothetical protein Syun_004217 [Stephania yunnanensis]|uniref:Uncharacterized protein n=1 Tax=Stephania yunnanensis TaxID=152371 RepID=A0AAP0Q188_9MAGN